MSIKKQQKSKQPQGNSYGDSIAAHLSGSSTSSINYERELYEGNYED
jgi:hypothetical protein